ncbi:hypothetical protein CLI64_18875 [Nostoc sp. CENA543]|uniref:DUF1496 domain-containing protein n=1 Tax=Nostoc sp. CENA543 TaxID=1869241 RepID=UPI000CA24107|nr:DUF1496 domain-containing protein [Nostoc sp. CENA543]AUT02284.1 hypothetical protein CLI64_18875 [Nostoc sp. CENA543]
MIKFAIDELNLANPQDELMEISEQEQQQILGGDCYYAGQRYSTGSTIQQGSQGYDKTCMSDGTWQWQPYKK